MIHGEELERFKKNNANMIDEKIIELAEEFVSEPEDLIGMVLRYRVDNI